MNPHALLGMTALSKKSAYRRYVADEFDKAAIQTHGRLDWNGIGSE